ncbi:MAG: hypothetical protein IKI15_02580 [Lachnospiraceae bacterium]|nr:hypothetical protein [Lachnospiraceae bacterium]
MGEVLNISEGMYLYIDPATTSYLIQIAVGVVIAIGTGIGIFRSKIKRAFKKKKDTEPVMQIEKKGVEGKDSFSAEDLLDDELTIEKEDEQN